jgi:hypothetical protein
MGRHSGPAPTGLCLILKLPRGLAESRFRDSPELKARANMAKIITKGLTRYGNANWETEA